MNKKYIVRSTARERNLSEEILSKGKRKQSSNLYRLAIYDWESTLKPIKASSSNSNEWKYPHQAILQSS